MSAWVIRSGRHGERDAWALQSGFSGGGWVGLPDLTRCATREEVAHVVAETFKGAADGKIANFAGQLWALRGRIAVGDLMVMPMKTTKQIAMGRVTGPYEYRTDEEDPAKRHVVRVDWQRVDLPRSAVKQDLLFTLGSAMSIFSPSKNNAVARLESLLSSGVDPGQVVPLGLNGKKKPGLAEDITEGVDEPELSPDIEEAARDQITTKIAEEFAGHGLATLVTALLEAEGLHCEQSPPGPDGGIDIVAGRGVLGLDELILVQVKSGGQVGSPVVTQLHGVMASHGAEQGLLVAWGGLSKPAKDALKGNNKLRVRVWQDTDVVDAVLARYESLDDDIRGRLPLKRMWMLTDTEG
jgi:restriction system protein